MFPGFVLVVILQFIPQLVPDLVALRHRRELSQFIHDGVHLSLNRFLQIAVHLFAFGQSEQLVLNGRAVADTGLHFTDQIAHCLLRCIAHFLVGQVLLFVEV